MAKQLNEWVNGLPRVYETRRYFWKILLGNYTDCFERWIQEKEDVFLKVYFFRTMSNDEAYVTGKVSRPRVCAQLGWE